MILKKARLKVPPSCFTMGGSITRKPGMQVLWSFEDVQQIVFYRVVTFGMRQEADGCYATNLFFLGAGVM